MNKRPSPDPLEGSSQKRRLGYEAGEASTSVRDRTRKFEDIIEETRAKEAATPPLRSASRADREAEVAPVPGNVYMQVREESERKSKLLEEAQQRIAEMEADKMRDQQRIAELEALWEAEKREKEALQSRLLEKEQAELEAGVAAVLGEVLDAVEAEQEALPQEVEDVEMAPAVDDAAEDAAIDDATENAAAVDDAVELAAEDENAHPAADDNAAPNAAAVDQGVPQQQRRPRRVRRTPPIAFAPNRRRTKNGMNLRVLNDNIDDLNRLFLEITTRNIGAPKISKALFVRVTGQYVGDARYPEYRLQSRILNPESLNILRELFTACQRLAAFNGRVTVKDKDVLYCLQETNRRNQN